MKNIFLTFCLGCLSVSSNAQLPVLSGLKLHLTGNSYLPASGATWVDLSGSLNDVAPVGTAPTVIPNAGGPALSGVYFNGVSDVMTRSHTNVTGFGNPEATIFVVRIANTKYTTLYGPYNAQWNNMIAIGEDNTYNNNFCMMGSWAKHNSSGGNWVNRDNTCYYSLLDSKPVLLTGVYQTGVGPNDLEYYVNGQQSTNAPAIQGSPIPYSICERGIAIGSNWDAVPNSIAPTSHFQGTFLEILAYEHALNPTDVAAVNQYLMTKYGITSNCPQTPACDPDFAWSMSTAAPGTYTFTPQHTNLPFWYRWKVNGTIVSAGSTFTAPGAAALCTVLAESNAGMTLQIPPTWSTTFSICLELYDHNGGFLCSQCFDLCHGDLSNTVNNNGCGPDFTLEGNTNTPNDLTLTPVAPYSPYTSFDWYDATTLLGSTTLVAPALTIPIPTGPFVYLSMAANSPSSGTCYKGFHGYHCFTSNTPSPYKITAFSDEPVNNREEKISIIPNPASGQITIQLATIANEETTVLVTDISGRKMYSTNIPVGNSKIEVPLNGFAKGVYFVRLQNKYGTLNSKFIKQ
jgi:hypothetical protein